VRDLGGLFPQKKREKGVEVVRAWKTRRILSRWTIIVCRRESRGDRCPLRGPQIPQKREVKGRKRGSGHLAATEKDQLGRLFSLIGLYFGWGGFYFGRGIGQNVGLGRVFSRLSGSEEGGGKEGRGTGSHEEGDLGGLSSFGLVHDGAGQVS